VLADEERGLIWAGALFDHAGVLRKETLTDGRLVDAQFEIPWSWPGRAAGSRTSSPPRAHGFA
jgi:hypothetical protein